MSRSRSDSGVSSNQLISNPSVGLTFGALREPQIVYPRAAWDVTAGIAGLVPGGLVAGFAECLLACLAHLHEPRLAFRPPDAIRAVEGESDHLFSLFLWSDIGFVYESIR